MQTMPFEVADTVRCAPEDRARLYDAMVEHRTSFFRMAYGILRQTEDAEDAVQAAYLSAWSAWGSYRGQSSLKTWLTSIVMNKALTELRTKRRQTWMSMDADPALRGDAERQLAVGQVTPEQAAMREQSAGWVRERVARLPKRTRTIVVLRYMEELSVEEIARSSGTTQASVKGHLQRGCKAMRKAFVRFSGPLA